MQGLLDKIEKEGFIKPSFHILYGHIFTVVSVSSQRDDGLMTCRADGVSRRSYLDKPDEEKGVEIARGRALKALLIKIKGGRISGKHVFMG